MRLLRLWQGRQEPTEELREFENVRQEPGSYRRLFASAYFDLYLWYDRQGGRVTGFQLCYDKDHVYRVLTWTEQEGYRHNRVDDGDVSSGGPKRTPILIPDGTFDAPTITELFLAAARGLDAAIVDLVRVKLAEYRIDERG